MTTDDALMKLRKMIYGATTGTIPNLEGHHGIHGFEATIGADTLKAVDALTGKTRAGKAVESDIEAVRAQCYVARTMNVLTDVDIQNVDLYLDEIKENL